MIMATPEMSTPLYWHLIHSSLSSRRSGAGHPDVRFLDLTDTGVPDVVAGFSPTQPPLPSNMSPSPSPNPLPPKPYQVAQAIPNPISPTDGNPELRHTAHQQHRQRLPLKS